MNLYYWPRDKELNQVAALARATLHDLSFVTQALSGTNELRVQFSEIRTTGIPQLGVLEVIPDTFIRVEIRGVARQLLQVQPFGRSTLEKVFDGLPPTNWRSVPDHHDVTWKLPQQDPQKAHDRFGVRGCRTDLYEQASIQRDSTNRRKMIVRQLYPHLWRLSHRSPRPNSHRQEVKSCFIYPQDGGLLLIGFFFPASALAATS